MRFSRNQRRFLKGYLSASDLDPRVIAAQLVAEQPAGARFPVGHQDQNWLNIALTNTKWYRGPDAWKDPYRAGRLSALWTQGKNNAGGYGRAAQGIIDFSRSGGKSIPEQIAALQRSGWASSGYPNIGQLVKQVAPLVVGLDGGPPPATRTSTSVDRIPGSTNVDTHAAILAALRAGGTDPASGRLDPTRSLLGRVRDELATGAYTTTSPDQVIKTITEKAAGAAAVPKAPRGGGYAGTEALIKQLADPIAKRHGITASNYKRTPERNAAVGGSSTSHHLTTLRNAYAADYPATGKTGERLAHEIAREFGISNFRTGTYDNYTIKIGGKSFRAQILWGVEGHHDHVHVGLEAV